MEASGQNGVILTYGRGLGTKGLTSAFCLPSYILHSKKTKQQTTALPLNHRNRSVHEVILLKLLFERKENVLFHDILFSGYEMILLSVWSETSIKK